MNNIQVSRFIFVIAFLLFYKISVSASYRDSIERFTVDKRIDVTSVKYQYKTSTCWSFSVLAMLESELIKAGKGEYDFSEMFIVHQAYIEKAERYIRMHGKINFGGGGALNDPIEIIKKYGLMPESAFSGLKEGCVNHDHLEMDAVLKDYVDGIIKNKKVSSAWKDGFVGILNAYLGKVPDKFIHKGKEYDPKSFAASLGLNFDNYYLMGSCIDKPNYEKYIVEVPDNWSWGAAYNIPFEKMLSVIDYSINKGYSVAIATDVSEKGFDWRKGIALAEDLKENESNQKYEPSMWIPQGDSTLQIIQEINITPEIRQHAFDTYETTDDHGLLIVGLAHDQKGKKFYLVKNSWGTTGSPYNGYIYMSESYIKYKVITFLVNKVAISGDILKQLKGCTSN